MSAVKDTKGQVVCDDDQILERWKEYYESLYSIAEQVPEECSLPNELEPCPLREEFKA